MKMLVALTALLGVNLASANLVLPIEALRWVPTAEKSGLGFGLDIRYQIGDEWGKKFVDKQKLANESAVFQRTAKATARFGGGTSFYLGKFNGYHVMATNHHVLNTEWGCKRGSANFTMLAKRFKCIKFFGHWPEIDLALFAVEVKKADEKLLKPLEGNFAFKVDVYRGQELLTIGFGVANNRTQRMVANRDSDCKVFSGDAEYRLMADPDRFNPAKYKAWSFSNGCDVSHGDSGSAMVDRKTGEVVGIIWTGNIPKSKNIASSAYLDKMLKAKSQEIWKELSYAVPAKKMGEFLTNYIQKSNLKQDTRDTLLDVLK